MQKNGSLFDRMLETIVICEKHERKKERKKKQDDRKEKREKHKKNELKKQNRIILHSFTSQDLLSDLQGVAKHLELYLDDYKDLLSNMNSRICLCISVAICTEGQYTSALFLDQNGIITRSFSKISGHSVCLSPRRIEKERFVEVFLSFVEDPASYFFGKLPSFSLNTLRYNQNTGLLEKNQGLLSYLCSKIAKLKHEFHDYPDLRSFVKSREYDVAKQLMLVGKASGMKPIVLCKTDYTGIEDLVFCEKGFVKIKHVIVGHGYTDHIIESISIDEVLDLIERHKESLLFDHLYAKYNFNPVCYIFNVLENKYQEIINKE